uniref:Uncharacterized protein n=1 Tax=Oryza punctata TaxID=4537 RepID=A0A0E0M7A1_ORYPU
MTLPRHCQGGGALGVLAKITLVVVAGSGVPVTTASQLGHAYYKDINIRGTLMESLVVLWEG